jgi:hypothetical protein
MGLMTKVDACLEQFAHRDLGHVKLLIVLEKMRKAEAGTERSSAEANRG